MRVAHSRSAVHDAGCAPPGLTTNDSLRHPRLAPWASMLRPAGAISYVPTPVGRAGPSRAVARSPFIMDPSSRQVRTHPTGRRPFGIAAGRQKGVNFDPVNLGPPPAPQARNSASFVASDEPGRRPISGFVVSLHPTCQPSVAASLETMAAGACVADRSNIQPRATLSGDCPDHRGDTIRQAQGRRPCRFPIEVATTAFPGLTHRESTPCPNPSPVVPLRC